MKSFLGPYLAGGMSVLGIWLVYENKQKIDTMVKNVMNKADQMIQEMKCSTQNNCNCSTNSSNNNN